MATNVTNLKVFCNEDDALLFWSVPQPIPNCRGFAIERTIKRKGSNAAATTEFLPNRVGFENDASLPATLDAAAAATPDDAPTKPSTEWPFQRFSWTDHDANTGDEVSYRVTPVVRNATSGKLELVANQASDVSKAKCLGKPDGLGAFKPFFNRGFVMSQFMARYLKENNLSIAQFKKQIAQEEQVIRTFLSGDLRLALLEQLETAKKTGGEVFAAIFEMADPQLIDALAALGKKAHVVLSNGSITPKKNEPAADARKRDENAAARQKLIDAGVDVEKDNRFLSPGPLGHNKFLVRTDSAGKAMVAWTGSTNWAPTGLCTQVNNGLLIEDPAVAQVYLDQFHLLRKSRSAFPKELMDANDKPKAVGADAPGKVRSIVWFTRTRKGNDMDALRAEVNKAKKGILFLMFMPGSTGLFSTVAAKSGDAGLYVRGVVSELPHGPGDESAVDVHLVDGTSITPLHLDIIQPEGVAHPFATFAAEVTHKQFIATVGHAIIHSKVVVVDPFTDDPTVITGSHNFSSSASTKNDENFIIIKGDKTPAEAYAVNIMGAYAHDRWRAYLAQTNKPFKGLRDNDAWMKPMMDRNQNESRFWGV
jgi:phosphatidylserine/phosphatidylglycerophosphate/cardiolipin synthase-like enzyme